MFLALRQRLNAFHELDVFFRQFLRRFGAIHVIVYELTSRKLWPLLKLETCPRATSRCLS
jgi:hypothetical protein